MSRQSDLERTRRGTHIADDSPATPEVDASLGDDHAAGNNLAKIRDILFGAQVRDHERRFTKLEAQLLAEAAQLRTDLKDRFASLEQYIRNEVETLIGRLSREEQSRTSAVDLLAGELQRLAATLQQTADRLHAQAEQGDQTLRDQLDRRSTSLADDLREKHAELSAALDAAVRQLSTQKTDRAALAALFQEVSQRLSHEQSPQGS
ncbi:hypothetical protein FBQ96_02365 [Nitrospirales bacterium NOB]|nr:MAG: hypothetical protein UZ03_NOB001001093 [Nitrospira sp. OLB3]MBV6468983.1 hypothetical protein [Nitrospirota bacterium]MCE7966363.1 hypothetical protein [Nitrospira sp. NTP2]MCK6493634.1 hypothetical protein [Nitrospira sp.]MDL1888421.1 hypothetical protein [Nitrospirales bacterium NOB]MEB2338180.1 hypothetical protein [Nitrospirales bacterium]